MTIKIAKIANVKTPTRGTPVSAGLDFYVPEDFPETSIEPGQDVLIPSGIKAKIPKGFALIANNKSGVATKKKLIHGASVVDEDYTGQIHLHLINVGSSAVLISPGEKIIQFLLEKQEYADVEVVEEEDLFVNFSSERGSGGFGSTGTN